MPTTQEKSTSTALHKKSTPQSRLLKIERTFDLPVAQVFEAFTTSEAIKAWWWPKGLHTDRVDYDFSKGGEYFINMKGYDPGGGGMTGEFEEIVPNKRIVMSDSFADANGRAISAKEAKMPGDWPPVIYITFDFEAADENKTHFVLSQEGIPNEMQKECIQGWNESFDKLEKYLSKREQ